MKKPLLSLFAFLLGNILFAQSSERPKPHLGGHINPEFTNCWNMLNSTYGQHYSWANMGNVSTREACVFLDSDGWTRNGKTHSFMIDVSADNVNLKVKVGDVFKCQYKGTLAQLGNGTLSQTFGAGILQM